MKLDFPAMLRDGLTKKQTPADSDKPDEETITESQNINEYYKKQNTNDNRRYDQNVINRQRVNKPKIEELRKKGYTITEYEDGTFTATKAIPPQPERPNVPTIADEDDELLDDFAIDNSDPTDENFVGPQIPEKQELDEKTMKKQEADKRGKKKKKTNRDFQAERKQREQEKREQELKEYYEYYNSLSPEEKAKEDKKNAAANAALQAQLDSDGDDDLY